MGDRDDDQLVGLVVGGERLEPLAHLLGIAGHRALLRVAKNGQLALVVRIRLRFLDRGIAARAAGVETHDEELAALRQPLGFRLGVGADDEHGGARSRCVEPRRRAELPPIGTRDLGAAILVDEVREREAGAEVRGDGRALIARSQQPHLRRRRAGRHREDLGVDVARRQRAVQEPREVRNLLREVVGAPVVAERARRQLIAPGRAPDAEIDPTGKERLEHAEALGDLERAVVLEHDAAGADADPRGARGDLADQHLGARARQPRCRVVLGEPVAMEAEPIAELGELERLVDVVRHDAAAAHG